jgi:glycosyltransferase involved in cell wall biosynthesis
MAVDDTTRRVRHEGRPAPDGASNRVLVVVEQLRRRVPGGIGVYVDGLLHGLTGMAGEGLELPDITLFASRARRSPDPLAVFGMPLASSRLPSAVMTRAWGRSLVHAPDGFGVLHATSFDVPPARGGALVVTVHDVAWRKVPDAYPTRSRRWHEAALQRVLERAPRLVVPSAAVADDVIAAGAAARDITVIPHGADHLPDPDDAAAEALLHHLGVPGDFVLSVGTLEPRKNLPRVVEACAIARSSVPEPAPLVVVGPSGWGPETPSRPGVVFAGAVSPEVLAALYGRARLLVYAPLLEGFGLPPVEAMRAGTPVVASPVPSIDDAAFEVDPYDVDAMARAIVRVSTDDGLRRELAGRGLARAGALTWRAAASAHARLWDALR